MAVEIICFNCFKACPFRSILEVYLVVDVEHSTIVVRAVSLLTNLQNQKHCRALIMRIITACRLCVLFSMGAVELSGTQQIQQFSSGGYSQVQIVRTQMINVACTMCTRFVGISVVIRLVSISQCVVAQQGNTRSEHAGS